MSRPLDRLLGKRADRRKPGEKKPGEKKPGQKPSEKAAPTIHLAPMPTPSKTSARQKPKEPTPQKPDIKLPPDAIRASKAGSKPLSEHLRKHEEKKKRDDLAAKKGPRARAARDRCGRRGARGAGQRKRSFAARRGQARRRPRKKARGGLATLGGREQRQLKRKRSTTAKRAEWRRRRVERQFGLAPAPHPPHGGEHRGPAKGGVVVDLPCTVRSFAEATGVSASKILGKLMAWGP